ncbi:MAG: hypothetical protein ACPG7F_03130 [Aggregatilineales bacterium]
MTVSDAMNYHIQYEDITFQHWNAESESFAGGDHLVTAIANGWDIEQCVQINHEFGIARFVTIYEFSLYRNGKTVVMPVVNNPYVERFMKETGIAIVSNDEQGDTAIA